MSKVINLHPRVIGMITVEDLRDKNGLYRAYLSTDEPDTDFSEFGGTVWLDVANVEQGLVSVHPVGRMRYVFTATEYEVLRGMMSAYMDDKPEGTLLSLKKTLGEAGADRLLEKLGLLGEPEPAEG